MPEPLTLPCQRQPDLFIVDKPTIRQRQEAIRLCNTECPAAEFARCAAMDPIPSSVMAGKAYDWRGKPAGRRRKLNVCVGEMCNKPLPAPRSSQERRIWCSEECRVRHRENALKEQRASSRAQADRVDSKAINALLVGNLTWDRASQALRTAVVTRHLGEGWSDPQIAHKYGITARKVRWIRERAGLAGNKVPAKLAG